MLSTCTCPRVNETSLKVHNNILFVCQLLGKHLRRGNAATYKVFEILLPFYAPLLNNPGNVVFRLSVCSSNFVFAHLSASFTLVRTFFYQYKVQRNNMLHYLGLSASLSVRLCLSVLQSAYFNIMLGMRIP